MDDSLLPEAAIAGFVAAVAGGAVGGFIGGALVGPQRRAVSREDAAGSRGRTPRRARWRARAARGGRLGAALSDERPGARAR